MIGWMVMGHTRPAFYPLETMHTFYAYPSHILHTLYAHPIHIPATSHQQSTIYAFYPLCCTVTRILAETLLKPLTTRGVDTITTASQIRT